MVAAEKKTANIYKYIDREKSAQISIKKHKISRRTDKKTETETGREQICGKP